MKIIMPTFEKIEWMPPTITLIKELTKLGHEVVYITIYPDEYYENFDSSKVSNVSLCNRNMDILRYSRNLPVVASIFFRIDNLVKKMISKRLGHVLEQVMDCNSILWVVNEMTVIYAGSQFLKKREFIFSIYELHPNSYRTRHIKKAAQYAEIVVVPEYNRAHMQKFFFQLQKLPVVLPNKPTEHPCMRELMLEEENIKNQIDEIKGKGKKILLYMGIINEERPLSTLIEAMENVHDQIELVIIGAESTYLKKLCELYPNRFKYLGFTQPPKHLNVASYADIGILNYVSDNNRHGLNALYCAPNKIYEYTGFGMPILCNDIPGLYYIVDKNECGVCVDFNDKKAILKGLEYCLNNYTRMSENAKKFYDDTNISEIIESIINDFQNSV